MEGKLVGDQPARDLTIYGFTFRSVRAAFWDVMEVCRQHDVNLEHVDCPELFRVDLRRPLAVIAGAARAEAASVIIRVVEVVARLLQHATATIDYD